MIEVNLPDSALAKLDALEDAARVAAAAARDLDTILSARRLEMSAAMSAGNEKRADELEHEVARLQPRLAAHRDAMNRNRSAVTRCKSWVSQLQLRGVPVEVVAAPPLRTRRAGSAEAAAAEVRGKIAAKREQLRGARTAPLPRDELTVRARKLVADLAAAARVRVTGGTATQPVVSVMCDPASPLAAVAWAAPDLLVERIVSQFAAPTEPPGDVATLEAELLALEREEEALVERAQRQGSQILRRDDADPRAVLGVALA
jgi:hypothetical protein